MSVMLSKSDEKPFVLIGTCTDQIYVYRMDPFTGELLSETIWRDMPNVSFMAVHPNSGLVYAVNEVEEFDGKPGGGVSVFSISDRTNLSILDRQSSGGSEPTYIGIEKTGCFALVANHTSGNVAMLPIQDDGRILPASDVVQHVGSSVHPERQTRPHPHCIIPDPANRFAIAADLGTDKLLIYRMDLDAGTLHEHSEVQEEAGSGPHRLIFNSEGQYAYVMNELNSTVVVYHYNADDGLFTRLQTITTLPRDFSDENLCGDIHLSPDEKHLYVSNRGLNNIVCFTIDVNSGHLAYQSQVPSNGNEPRTFAFDPTGHFMIVVHQKSENAVVFKIDPETGDLSPSGHEVMLSMPVHVLFA